MKKIVIIDDEPDSLTLMRDLLEEYTCRVYTATTGREGLRFIETQKPDLVFLDLRLPDTSGEEVLKQCKAKFPQVKVIIGTAYGSDDVRKQLIDKGADGFFDKPIDLNAFEKKARELIGRLSEIRLLMIDDDNMFCNELKVILENDVESKWLVHFSTTGEDGLKNAQDLMPDLISLDICLSIKGDSRPFASGVEVYKELKRRGFQIPVVFLASYIDSGDAEELHKEGLGAIYSKSELMGAENLTHFLNVLKRIALRGT